MRKLLQNTLFFAVAAWALHVTHVLDDAGLIRAAAASPGLIAQR